MKYLFSILLIAFSATSFSQTIGIIRTSGNSGADSLRISNDSVFLKIGGVWVFQDTLPNPQPKEYIASITQSGTDAPVATVVKDDFGDIFYNYGSDGHFDLESSSTPFTDGKTEITFTNQTFYSLIAAAPIFVNWIYSGESKINLVVTNSSGTGANGVLGEYKNIIHITVYP